MSHQKILSVARLGGEAAPRGALKLAGMMQADQARGARRPTLA